MSVNNTSYLELRFPCVLSWLPRVARPFPLRDVTGGCMVFSGNRGLDGARIPATVALGIKKGWLAGSASELIAAKSLLVPGRQTRRLPHNSTAQAFFLVVILDQEGKPF